MENISDKISQDVTERDFLWIINRQGHACSDYPKLHSWLHGTDATAYECFKLYQQGIKQEQEKSLTAILAKDEEIRDLKNKLDLLLRELKD